MEKDAKIYIAGHKGLVGSAIVRELKRRGYENLICRTRRELDLENQQAVADFFPARNRSMCSLRPRRSGESAQIPVIRRILSIIIS